MKSLKTFCLQRPVGFSFFLIIVSIAVVTYIPLNLFFLNFFDSQTSNYIAGILEQTFVSLCLIAMLKQFGLQSSIVFAKPLKWGNLWIVWPMLIVILLNSSDVLTGNIRIDTKRPMIIILYILVYLTTGIFEELLCRGVILTIMLRRWGETKRGCYYALILSSFLFGFAHIIHYILHDATLLATATQIAYATFIGVFFGAITIRSQNILPAIFMHGLFDISGELKEIAVNGGMKYHYLTINLSDAIISVLLILPLLIYGLFLFRKVSPTGLFSEQS